MGWDDADLEAIEVLRPLLDAGTFLPWTEWALRPAALAAVCNEIVFADRREVVELGSGVSTVVLARLLAQRGGRLTSVEHDPSWSEVVRRLLEVDRLTEAATLIEAPLEPHPLALGEASWYAKSALGEIPGEIDLLLVDGPPGNDDGLEPSRYPALPVLEAKLAGGAMVVLDDAERPGERAVLDRWRAELPRWTFTTREAGIATGARGRS